MDEHSPPSYPINIMNRQFPNPVGLAAGFDRDGKLISSLSSIGFGFIEIGTINVDSEIDVDDELNNVIHNLYHSKKHSNKMLIGISLGSLRDTIDDHTINDYLQGMKALLNYSDYIVINLSRPGSSMRSDTSDSTSLHNLLDKIKNEHTKLCEINNNHVPILIKVAIDSENRNALPEALTMASKLEFDGLLIAFENWPCINDVIETVREISTLTNQLPLIVVGGIKKADDMFQILNAGAKLVQCYTLLAEQGPAEMKKMIRELTLLSKENYSCHERRPEVSI